MAWLYVQDNDVVPPVARPTASVLALVRLSLTAKSAYLLFFFSLGLQVLD